MALATSMHAQLARFRPFHRPAPQPHALPQAAAVPPKPRWIIRVLLRVIPPLGFPLMICLLIAGCGASISGPAATSSNTTSALVASPGTLTAVQITQLTATVTNSSGAAFVAPSGNVTFIGNSGTALGVSTLATNQDDVSATGLLTLSGGAFATGANIVSASYPGDLYHTSSVSTNIIVTVSSAVTVVNTAAVLASSLTTITEAENTTLTATVVAASGTAAPTGTVAFVDQSNNITLGTAVLGLGGSTTSASAAILASGSSMNVGLNSILAEYQGNTSYAASTSSPVSITVAATTQ
jgi:hypothetical protein